MSQSEMQERVKLGSRPPGVPAPEPQAYRVPTDVVTLPSRGLVYPVESPLHRRDGVEIRGMTARDEDILTSRALLRQGRAMSMLMQSCLMDKSIDVESMLVGDRNAVLVAIRMSSYGAQYTATITCPECEAQFENSFDLSKLEIHFLDAEPAREGANAFEFVLPSGRRVEFKLLTGAEEREISDELDRRKKKVGGMAESNVTARLFHQIVSIDGVTDRQTLSGMVRDMPARDSLELRRYMDRISPYVDMVQEVRCSGCGTSAEVDMPVGAEFFWPSTR